MCLTMLAIHSEMNRFAHTCHKVNLVFVQTNSSQFEVVKITACRGFETLYQSAKFVTRRIHDLLEIDAVQIHA